MYCKSEGIKYSDNAEKVFELRERFQTAKKRRHFAFEGTQRKAMAASLTEERDVNVIVSYLGTTIDHI